MAKQLVFVAAASLAMSAQFASAQAEHVTHASPYSLLASALKSEFVAAAIHGSITLSLRRNRGLLNVVVVKKMADEKSIALPAAVIAYHTNLIGQRETIAMQSVTRSDRISYLGTFEFDSSSQLHFTIEAKPQGSDENIRWNSTRSFSA